MKFRTPIKLNPPKFQLDIKDNIILIGSCFSENIAKHLEAIKWNINTNPHGILFNPASIYTSIKELKIAKVYNSDDLFQSSDLWYSWNHHGCFAQPDEEQTINLINESLNKSRLFLKESNCCIITLGSAWVYKNKATNMVVANCHKIPQTNFQKQLLSINEIKEYLSETISLLKECKADIKIILTLSPVRYLKDGFVENARSKAHLLAAIHEIEDKFDFVDYFPAYEIFIDDLRDYRFNNEDLVHPNEMAIQYIWEQFINHYFSEDIQQIIEELQNWRKLINHRPLHKDSEQYKAFKNDLIKKTLKLQSKYEHLDFTKELDLLNNLKEES